MSERTCRLRGLKLAFTSYKLCNLEKALNIVPSLVCSIRWELYEDCRESIRPCGKLDTKVLYGIENMVTLFRGIWLSTDKR